MRILESIFGTSECTCDYGEWPDKKGNRRVGQLDGETHNGWLNPEICYKCNRILTYVTGDKAQLNQPDIERTYCPCCGS